MKTSRTLPDISLAKPHEKGLPAKKLSDGANKTLMAFDWPGNVRELENLLHRICALYGEDIINGDVIKSELDRSTSDLSGAPASMMTSVSGENLSQTIRAHLDKYFDYHEDGMPPTGLYQRILRELERPPVAKGT